MTFCKRVLIFDLPFEGRFSWRKFLDMVDVLVHVEPNRLKMDPEDNCMVTVAQSALERDSAEAQGAPPVPCCLCQHRPYLSA